MSAFGTFFFNQKEFILQVLNFLKKLTMGREEEKESGKSLLEQE